VSIEYVREKFWQAIRVLVSGGSIQHRLEHAAIALHVLQPEDIPARQRDEFVEVWDTLTKHDPEIQGEGSIRASIRKLSEDEASDIGRKIFDMYIAIRGGI